MFADRQKAKGEIPYATFEASEADKYPKDFTLRPKCHEGAGKVGGTDKSFDPEVYRQQILAYNTGKVAALQRAYQGAGDILHHPGASRPESQQVPASHNTGLDTTEAAAGMPHDTCLESPPPESVDPPSQSPHADAAC